MLYYLPIEPYEERYTFQLLQWTTSRLQQRGVPHEVVLGTPVTGQITVGRVLDVPSRCIYAMTQLADLLTRPIADADVIYVADMFHPGWESLPYVFDQQHIHPRIVTRCFAQSVDPDDFTFPMRRWMRHYEEMVVATADVIFVASQVHKEMLETALPAVRQVVVTGLPFDQHEVRQRATVMPWERRQNRVVYTSRFDAEKQPHFWLDLVELVKTTDSPLRAYEFAVITGAQTLRSNDATALQRAQDYVERGWLTVYAGQSKNAYYAKVAASKIQFNCARQDFVSNTMNEAGALGAVSVVPAFRSFPEATFNSRRLMYLPWSVIDAHDKIVACVNDPPLAEMARIVDYQHQSIDKEITCMLGKA